MAAPLGRERRWRREDPGRDQSRGVLVALVLACAVLMVLDTRGGDGPVEAARRAVGEVVGPVETFSADVVAPFTAVPDYFRTRNALREEVRDLEAENQRLRSEVRRVDLDRNRLAEYDGLVSTAADTGYSLVPARVVAIGPRQSFSRTVTIDAGSSSGISPDLTVVNDDGLVGRVVRVTRSTATVLLLGDASSVVGGRLSRSMELGFLHGRGDIGADALLDLELVDDTTPVDEGDVVTTWGSEGSGPYVPGIPIGEVVSVTNSPRETSRTAAIAPYVDFTSLDLVGVVVPGGTTSDRDLITAEGQR